MKQFRGYDIPLPRVVGKGDQDKLRLQLASRKRRMIGVSSGGNRVTMPVYIAFQSNVGVDEEELGFCMDSP